MQLCMLILSIQPSVMLTVKDHWKHNWYVAFLGEHLSFLLLVWRCLGGGVRRGETSKRED